MPISRNLWEICGSQMVLDIDPQQHEVCHASDHHLRGVATKVWQSLVIKAKRKQENQTMYIIPKRRCFDSRPQTNQGNLSGLDHVLNVQSLPISRPGTHAVEPFWIVQGDHENTVTSLGGVKCGQNNMQEWASQMGKLIQAKHGIYGGYILCVCTCIYIYYECIYIYNIYIYSVCVCVHVYVYL